MFLVGGAILVLVVAMLGKLSADRLKRRIARINCTLSHPDELASMPELPRRARDEIDELAANSAQVILRVRNLLEAHSDTTDRLAHEIRTPLTHLDARLVKALETQPDEQVTKKRLTEARSEIRRLVSMLESLLDIAWSKARLSDRLMLTPVDMSALVTNLCELYADSAEDAGLACSGRWSPALSLTVTKPSSDACWPTSSTMPSNTSPPEGQSASRSVMAPSSSWRMTDSA